MAPDIEKIVGISEIEESLNKIIMLCREQNVPIIYSLNKKILGQACVHQGPKISIIGLLKVKNKESFIKTFKIADSMRREYYQTTPLEQLKQSPYFSMETYSQYVNSEGKK